VRCDNDRGSTIARDNANGSALGMARILGLYPNW
jgi:hypothetical protein